MEIWKSGKIWKKIFYIKMSITTIKNFKSSQISIGKEEQKRSKTGFKYNSIPIFYDEGALDLLVKGRLRIFKHDKDYSIGLDVDETNKSCFESIEAKINKEADLKERLDLIKGERFQRVYSKLYTNSKGKISASFYELKGGKKKLIEDPTDWVGVTFTGKILFRITGVFSAKKVKTITLFAKEVLILKKEEEEEQEPTESDLISIDSDDED